MKKIIVIITAAATAFFLSPVGYGADMPTVSARAAAVIEAASGRVIFQKNGDERLPMASTTKIMTAAAVIMMEENLEKTAVVSEAAATASGSSAGLRAGDEITLRALLYCLMLESGNDAAEALNGFFHGALPEIMNIIAKEHLGLKNTRFQNVHGLPAKDHYSSAKDLAYIMRFALSYKTFGEISGSVSASVKSGSRTLYLQNHNRLLRELSGCDGGKTGFTSEAGRCLVSTAERGGVRLICATLDDPDDWRDHAALYEAAFASISGETVFPKRRREIAVAGGVKEKIAAVTDGIFLPLLEGETVVERASVPAFLYSPARAGDVIGVMEYISDGEIIASRPIYLVEDSEPSFFEAFAVFFLKLWL